MKLLFILTDKGFVLFFVFFYNIASHSYSHTDELPYKVLVGPFGATWGSVSCLTWKGEAGDWTANPGINRQPAVPPEP